ncbi:DUF4097 family beta strand repeat-containing protein [Clostridiaceae bacterium M8S5]|nr:DUF4097 family beta strand repeat-containing protein [Clostridiaceae bacterium M8S5]
MRKTNKKNILITAILVMVISITTASTFACAKGGFFSSVWDYIKSKLQFNYVVGDGNVVVSGEDKDLDDGENTGKEIKIDDKKIIDDVEGVTDISIESVASNITIIPSKSNKFQAHLYGTAKGYKEGKEPKLICKREDDKIVLEIDHKGSKTFGKFVSRSFKCKLDIEVPKSVYKNIKVNSTSGDIKINDISTNDFSIKAVSGDIEVKDCKVDDISCKNTSGDIIIDKISAKVTASTVSGDVELNMIKMNGDIKANSISGDIEVSVPEKSDMDLYMKTTSGTLEADVSGKNSSKNTISATIGNGTNKVNLTTISGDVSIK